MFNQLNLPELCVVDIGASGGLCEPFASSKNILAVLFDPDLRADLPKEEKQDYGRAITFPVALSNKEQPLQFFLTREQECSSCLEPNTKLICRYAKPERFAVSKVITLKSKNLDDCMHSARLTPDFIKVDVQGFEYEVLQGAANSLENVCGVLLETEFEPLYKNQKLFPEIHALMRSKGFEIFDLQRCFYKRRLLGYPEQKGQLVFGNALYLRPPEKLDLWKIHRIKTMMRVYQLFGYVDCYETARELFGVHDLPGVVHKKPPKMSFLRKKAFGFFSRLTSLLQRVNSSLLWHEPFGSSDRPFSNLPRL